MVTGKKSGNNAPANIPLFFSSDALYDEMRSCGSCPSKLDMLCVREMDLSWFACSQLALIDSLKFVLMISQATSCWRAGDQPSRAWKAAKFTLSCVSCWSGAPLDHVPFLETWMSLYS